MKGIEMQGGKGAEHRVDQFSSVPGREEPPDQLTELKRRRE